MFKYKSAILGSNIISKVMTDRLVLINTENKNRYIFNDTGKFILESLIKKDISISDIIGQVAEEYCKNLDIVAHDVEFFLQDLEKEKLIYIKK